MGYAYNNCPWDVIDAGYEFEGSKDLSLVDIEASDGGEGMVSVQHLATNMQRCLSKLR